MISPDLGRKHSLLISFPHPPIRICSILLFEAQVNKVHIRKAKVDTTSRRISIVSLRDLCERFSAIITVVQQRFGLQQLKMATSIPPFTEYIFLKVDLSQSREKTPMH